MGREVRRVPQNWEHPKDQHGYIPLFDGHKKAAREWDACKKTLEKRANPILNFNW